ncbi:MAG: acireductone synthase [Bacteriovoracaceae bacterium]
MSELIENHDFFLFDIEGTTTSVDFVYEVLFPYAKDNLEVYWKENYSQLGDVIELVRETVLSEKLEENYSDPKEYFSLLEKWIDQDRKHTGLKLLQGKMWKLGYESGELEAHFFEDFPPFLEKLKSRDKKIGIYSSGSVQAQKLIFQYSEFGDLSSYIGHNFDTQVGAKGDVSSYQTIISEIQCLPERVIFFSDVIMELDAASSSGMRAIHSLRGKDSSRHERYTCFQSFDELH